MGCRARAQSFIEYAIMLSVVTVAVLMMGLYIRRAVQANMRIIEAQINTESMKK